MPSQSPQRRIPYPQEAPGLHEAHARGEMRRTQQPLEQSLIEWLGKEVTHIPTRRDDSVDGTDFQFAEVAHGFFRSQLARVWPAIIAHGRFPAPARGGR